MESIFIITAVHVKNKDIPTFDDRAFGFFFTEEDARKAAAQNQCNMIESYYNYLVIEQFLPGIHAKCREIQWYKADNNQWIPIEKKPEEFEILCNWGLG